MNGLCPSNLHYSTARYSWHLETTGFELGLLLSFCVFTYGFWRLFHSRTLRPGEMTFKFYYRVATSTSKTAFFCFFSVSRTCLTEERDGGAQATEAGAGTTAYCCLILLADEDRFSVTCRKSLSGSLAP